MTVLCLRPISSLSSLALPSLSFPVFLPTIINGLGYSSTNQLLSVTPNAHIPERGPFVLADFTVAAAGYAMVFATRMPGAQYAGTVVVAAGLLPSIACQLAWMGGTFGGEVKRAVAVAVIVDCGNLGGCVFRLA